MTLLRLLFSAVMAAVCGYGFRSQGNIPMTFAIFGGSVLAFYTWRWVKQGLEAIAAFCGFGIYLSLAKLTGKK
jgi:hypothetical protein